MALMLSDVLVVFDHLKHTITILVNVYAEPGDDVAAAYEDALQTIAKARRLLAGPVPIFDAKPHKQRPEFTSNMPREDFESMVARIVEYVHAGDAFQVVPSQRWSADLELDPFSVYRGLRVVNPCPYMYFLRLRRLSRSSARRPEPLVRVEGRQVIDPADRRHPAARRRRRGGRRRSPRSCSPTRRSGPSTSCSSTSAATTSAASCEFGTVEVDELHGRSRATRTSCTSSRT